jgi:hypothetical protein
LESALLHERRTNSAKASEIEEMKLQVGGGAK